MMLPRAAIHDPRPRAAAGRALHAIAWWRSPSPGWFTVGHCATAGLLQLTALCVGLAAYGRPVPPVASLLWAGLGLAVTASVAALLTVAALTAVTRTPRAAFAWTAAIGLAYYVVLPTLALGAMLWPIAPLLPVAAAWHLTFARVPVGACSVERCAFDSSSWLHR